MIVTAGCLSLVALFSTAFSPQAKLKFKNLWKQVDDGLFASVTETSVLNYQEFLHYLDAEEAKKFAFDTTVWSSDLRYTDPLAEQYTHHPAFHEYPAVGVSYAGAQAYCEWLTEIINRTRPPHIPFTKVRFRLPTEAEWEKAAAADIEKPIFPWTTPKGFAHPGYVFTAKGQLRANFKLIDQSFIQEDPETGASIIVDKGSDYSADGYMITAPVRSFTPNPWGLYHMAGNVSEMVAEPGIAKGGSWNSTGYYLRINSQESYAGPSAKVGFRVFMEVIEE